MGGAQVALRCYGGDGRAHFGRFGRFFAERVGVGVGFLREDLEFLFFETLVLCVVKERGICAVSKVLLLTKGIGGKVHWDMTKKGGESKSSVYLAIRPH